MDTVLLIAIVGALCLALGLRVVQVSRSLGHVGHALYRHRGNRPQLLLLVGCVVGAVVTLLLVERPALAAWLAVLGTVVLWRVLYGVGTGLCGL